MSMHSSANYYQDNKEIQKKAQERYQSFSKEKEKKHEHGYELCKNLSHDEKERLAEGKNASL